LEKKVEAEHDANKVERERSQGTFVTFGQIVQLQHEMTNSYLHASSSDASYTDAQNMKVSLIAEPKKRLFFSPQPFRALAENQA